jgi:hypothetical protein
MARLQVDDQWTRISLRLRTVWIRRDEITVVRRRSPGSVAFDSRDGSFDSVVWFSSADAVLAAFARSGWPIEPPRRVA